MQEKEFWWELQLRLNSIDTLSALGYCDGFEPKKYTLGISESQIQGNVSFVNGKSYLEQKFKIVGFNDYEPIEAIRWGDIIESFDREGSVEVAASRVTIICG